MKYKDVGDAFGGDLPRAVLLEQFVNLARNASEGHSETSYRVLENCGTAATVARLRALQEWAANLIKQWDAL